MIFTNLLTASMRLEVFFFLFQKHLTTFGTMVSYLNWKKILNDQVTSWANVKAGVTQGSILGALLFLIYMNDLPKRLSSNAKLFADNTLLFFVFHDILQQEIS